MIVRLSPRIKRLGAAEGRSGPAYPAHANLIRLTMARSSEGEVANANWPRCVSAVPAGRHLLAAKVFILGSPAAPIMWPVTLLTDSLTRHQHAILSWEFRTRPHGVGHCVQLQRSASHLEYLVTLYVTFMRSACFNK